MKIIRRALLSGAISISLIVVLLTILDWQNVIILSDSIIDSLFWIESLGVWVALTTLIMGFITILQKPKLVAKIHSQFPGEEDRDKELQYIHPNRYGVNKEKIEYFFELWLENTGNSKAEWITVSIEIRLSDSSVEFNKDNYLVLKDSDYRYWSSPRYLGIRDIRYVFMGNADFILETDESVKLGDFAIDISYILVNRAKIYLDCHYRAGKYNFGTKTFEFIFPKELIISPQALDN